MVRQLNDPKVKQSWTGPLSQWRGLIGGIGKDLGFEVNEQGLANYGYVQSALVQFALDSKQDGAGQISNFEQRLFAKASPNLTRGRTANIMVSMQNWAQNEWEINLNNEYQKFNQRFTTKTNKNDTFHDYLKNEGIDIINQKTYEAVNKEFQPREGAFDEDIVGSIIMLPPEDDGPIFTIITQDMVDQARAEIKANAGRKGNYFK